MRRRVVNRPRLTEEELDLVLATQTAERQAQTNYERQSLHPAFKRGYDSDRWPFDIRRAIASMGYRRGIRRAMVNEFYNYHWRRAALYEMHNIVLPIVERREAQVKALMEYYEV